MSLQTPQPRETVQSTMLPASSRSSVGGRANHTATAGPGPHTHRRASAPPLYASHPPRRLHHRLLVKRLDVAAQRRLGPPHQPRLLLPAAAAAVGGGRLALAPRLHRLRCVGVYRTLQLVRLQRHTSDGNRGERAGQRGGSTPAAAPLAARRWPAPAHAGHGAALRNCAAVHSQAPSPCGRGAPGAPRRPPWTRAARPAAGAGRVEGVNFAVSPASNPSPASFRGQRCRDAAHQQRCMRLLKQQLALPAASLTCLASWKRLSTRRRK